MLSWVKRSLRSPYLLALCIGSYINFALRGNELTDSFHQGEFFTSLDTSRLEQGFDLFNIHGALDWIPAVVALTFHSPSNYFVTTVIIYQLISLITVLIFINSVVLLSVQNKVSLSFAHFISVTGFLFLDYRELGTMIVLNGILRYMYKDFGLSWRVLLGLGVPFSLLWYPGRGLVSLVATIIALLFSPKVFQFLGLMTTWFISFVFLGLADPRLSLSHTLKNLFFVGETSHIWRYSEPLLSIPVARLLLISALLIMVLLIINLPKIILSKSYAIFLIYGAHAAAYLIFSLNRADSQHILMSTWWILLYPLLFPFKTNSEKIVFFLLLLIQVKMFIGLLRGRPDRFFVMLVIGLIILYLLKIFFEFVGKDCKSIIPPIQMVSAVLLLVVGFSNIQKSDINVVTSLTGSIRNIDVVNSGIVWAYRTLSTQGTTCYFDFTNQGLLSGLLARPSCTFASYPMYISDEMQKEIIGELELAAPTAILYSSSNWSSRNIDGESMSVRLPILDSYIRETWTKKTCLKETCVLYK